MKLLEHGKKMVERVLEKRLCIKLSVDEMQFGSMHERGKIDAAFISRRMQEEHHAKGKKLYMCFVNLEKAFDRVPKSVGMGIEEERNIRSVGYISEESV